MEEIIIIGSGCAGMGAAIYAARAGMSPLVIEGAQPGGLLTTTSDVENFPGFPEGVNGFDLLWKMREQAQKFGARIENAVVEKVDFSGEAKKVFCSGEKVFEAKKIVVATGSSPRMTGAKGEAEMYGGKGVSACATCDGFFYRKKDVAVVGGGDTACEEATYLASLCRKVYLIVRKPHLRASKAMQQRVFNTPNIEVLFEHNTAEVLGDESGVTGALLRRNDGSERKIDIAGFFLAIGHHPNTELFAEQLALDAEGYIKVEPGTSITNIEGVFAAGDVKDPHYRQAITAAASGCVAALDCERFLLQ